MNELPRDFQPGTVSLDAASLDAARVDVLTGAEVAGKLVHEQTLG